LLWEANAIVVDRDCNLLSIVVQADGNGAPLLAIVAVFQGILKQFVDDQCADGRRLRGQIDIGPTQIKGDLALPIQDALG